MKYTNKYNLPSRIIRVITGKYKNRKPEPIRMSVTDLIEEPLPRTLFIEKWDDIVRDYSDYLTMVQGTALHDRYEMVAEDDDDTEHKFEDIIGQFLLVGRADNYRDNSILDVKQTAVYGPQYKIDKWTAQTNIYAWQRRKRGFDVDKILIDVWYRNWQLKNIYWRDYPPIPYEEIELDLWTFEQQQSYIESRIKLHSENPYKECSNKQKGVRWEAYKNKNKTPSKVGGTYVELEEWAETEERLNSKLHIDIKKSEPKTCTTYCKSRSVCDYANSKGVICKAARGL